MRGEVGRKAGRPVKVDGTRFVFFLCLLSVAAGCLVLCCVVLY